MPFKKVDENGVDIYHCKHCNQYLGEECFAPSRLKYNIRCCRECQKAKEPMCQGCGVKMASFGFEKRTHCAGCIKPGMVDLKNKNNMCIKCKKIIAYYGFESGKAICCSGCKDPGMVNLRGKNQMCTKCNKVVACFAKEGEEASHCGSCKDPGMVDVVNTRCDEEGCNKLAIRKGPKPSKCTGHGGGYRCINCGDPVYRHDKEKKYCCACYHHVHKLIPKYRKVKERQLEKEFDRCYTDYFVYNKMQKTDCGHVVFPDWARECNSFLLIIECDENQHKQKSYQDCKNDRDMKILYNASRPVVMIRFNPDGYVNKDKKKVKGCFKDTVENYVIKRKTNRKKFNKRWNVLKNEIDKVIASEDEVPEKEFTEILLFFDDYDCNF